VPLYAVTAAMIFAFVSGGLSCVGDVVLIAGLLRRFVRYKSEPA
jgi:hypothetical protein